MPERTFDPRGKSEDYITRSEFKSENVNIREQFSKIIDDLDRDNLNQGKVNDETLAALTLLHERVSKLERRMNWIDRTGTKRSETLN